LLWLNPAGFDFRAGRTELAMAAVHGLRKPTLIVRYQ
jgi:hypothetical protein